MPFEEISRIFKALGHPTRLRIACGLCREPSSLTRIHGMLGESISTLAQHIAVLRRCGILMEERRGPEIFLRVSDQRVRRFLKTLCPGNTEEPPPEWAWERLRSRGSEYGRRRWAAPDENCRISHGRTE